MADKRTYDLTQEPNKTFDQSLIMDKSGLGEAKRMLIKTLQRTRVVNEIDASGSATSSADFTEYDFIEIFINQNNTCNISNIEDNETVYLGIYKGADDVITLGGILGLEVKESSQIGLIYVLYRITSKTTTRGSIYYAELINNQRIDTSITLTPSVGTVTVLTYFDSVTNNNRVEFEVNATYNHTSYSSITLTINNWGVEKTKTGYTPASVNVQNFGANIPASCRISDDTIIIDLDSTISSDCNILINGQFKIN